MTLENSSTEKLIELLTLLNDNDISFVESIKQDFKEGPLGPATTSFYEAYTEYKRILDELNIIINNKCAEWKSMVINHYNNDDIMSIIIEDAQRYQNILSAFYDIINSNNSIDTNDKDELLEYIAELNFECEESLKYD